MKKLVIIVMMIAIATFMAAAMASADDHDGWGIHGQYAVIATGACLHSTGGFVNVNPNPAAPPIWTPAEGSEVWGAPVMAYATYVFERDGTGGSSVVNNIITLPPGDPILFANYPHFVGARQVLPALTPTPFTYQVAHDGVLTVQQGPLTLTGMVSTDHKTLTLANGDQVQPYLQSATHPNSSAICNVGRILIRVGE
jgi:hypothetical protein